MQIAIQWIDALWIAVALIVCHKPQKAMAVAYVMAGMVMMRLMIELMGSIGYQQGIMGLWNAPVSLRGQIVYNLFHAIFLTLAYFSPDTRGPIFLAGAISMFFMAAVVFSAVMVI